MKTKATKPAKPTEACATCRFYMVDGGFCRRFPPQPIVTKREKPDKAWWQWAFPTMTPIGWCGEWKAGAQ